MEVVKRELRPEFINRIDEIIVFHKLNDDEIYKIIDLMLKDVQNRLKLKIIMWFLMILLKNWLPKKAWIKILS